VIYNPRAGKIVRSGGGLIERAVEILKQEGHSVTVAPTTGPHMAGAMARAHIAGGADLNVLATDPDAPNSYTVTEPTQEQLAILRCLRLQDLVDDKEVAARIEPRPVL